MAIKSILLAYSGEQQNSGGLKLAIQMARKYDAHLTGVVAHGESLMETRFSRYMNKSVHKMLQTRDCETVEMLRSDFELRVSKELPEGRVSFLDLHANRTFTLTQASRHYDIVVTGRRAFEPGHEHFGASPQEIALDSGRPVILVPQGYDAPALNDHALIAWDGKRAAARALSDAMHILETKAQVSVLSVGDKTPDPIEGDTIETFLTRHGIKVNRLHIPKTQPHARGVAATILDVCKDQGAGLLVMGAYQRSVTEEAMFGGTTVDILTDAHLPVLMSH